MPNTAFDLTEAVVEYAAGTKQNWDNFTLPIPSNMVIFTSDTKIFKRGDGVHRYSDLPPGPSIAGIALGEQTVLNVLTSLLPANDDSLIVIDNEIYKASSSKLTDIVTRIAMVTSRDNIQTADMDTIASQFGMVNTAITSADNGKLAVISSHKMSPGVLPDDMSVSVTSSSLNIVDFSIYSDAKMTKKVAALSGGHTYYARITAVHDQTDTDLLTFSLTENSDYITVTSIGRGVFKIEVGQPATLTTATFTANVLYNADSETISVAYSVSKYTTILQAVYGGSGNDAYNAVAIDASDNIYAAGYYSVGTLNCGLVVKYDSNMNVIAAKVFSGASSVLFNAIAVDASGNVYAAGVTYSEGVSGSGLLVKYDSDLNVLAKIYYGGTGLDTFLGVKVNAVDGKIYVVGSTAASGAGGSDALIIKFDTDLTILASKTYGGTNYECYNCLAIDATGNIYAAGYYNADVNFMSAAIRAFITKFDASLNVLANVVTQYTTMMSYFTAIAYNAATGTIVAVGPSANEGSANNYDSFITIFDSNLNLLNKRLYGSAGYEYFYGVKIDANGNIWCCGSTNTSGGLTNAGVIVKYDSNLNIISQKAIDSPWMESLKALVIDSSNSVITVGSSSAEGQGGYDCSIFKLPNTVPTGSFSGTVLTNFSWLDINLNSNISANGFTSVSYTLGTPSLTATTSAGSSTDSTGVGERDLVVV